MRPTFKFIIGLVLILAILSWVTAVFVQRSARRWFENDIHLRSELVVRSAREALSANWSEEDHEELARVLVAITQDERIMGATACDAKLNPLAATPNFPAEFSCAYAGAHVRPSSDSPNAPWSPWYGLVSLPGGPVLVSAIPVQTGEQIAGFVVLFHDFKYAEQREAATRRFVFLDVRLPGSGGVRRYSHCRAFFLARLERRVAAAGARGSFAAS